MSSATQDMDGHDLATRVIRTPDQRLRVFVSSTLKELADERMVARQAIEHVHLSPVLFELGARPYPAKELYRAYLEQSHIFLGIYWQRYGWVAQDMPISGLEDEYNLSRDMPRLIYLKTPAPEREPRLKQMMDQIANDNVSYKYFTTCEELQEAIENDLIQILTERFELSETAVGLQVKTPSTQNRHLPKPPTPLIGREQELAALQEIIQRENMALVTLTGPGGTGKSRLALQLALDIEDRFADGVYFIDLSSIRQCDYVMPAIAHTLGLREVQDGPSISAVLYSTLRDKQLLLVLDNFEQVLDAAPVVIGLLQNCPKLRILITSRAPLKLRGEHEFPVAPLGLPDIQGLFEIDRVSQSAAVQLFIQRTLEVKPDFAIRPENARAIAEICYRLDGLPLAIELAAARSKLLSPQAMLNRLEAHLPLLNGGARDLPERQQTLSNTIEWSHNLLNDQGKILFRRLAVFIGGWTFEAAEAICNPSGNLRTDFLDLLGTLVDNNLIRQVETDDGEMRFTMLETIHAYAWERFNDSDEIIVLRQCHAQFFLDMVEETLPYQFKRFPESSIVQLNTEFDNLRAAMQWSCTPAGDSDMILRFVYASAWFWFISGHLNEGYTWCMEALSRTEGLGPTLQRGRAFAWAGSMGFTIGKYVQARADLEQSIAIARQFGDQQLLIMGLTHYALVLTGLGEYRLSVEACAECLELVKGGQFDWMKTLTLRVMGDNHLVLSGIEEARRWYEESLQLAHQFGDSWLLSLSLRTMALVHTLAGNYSGALPMFKESIGLMRATGDRWGLVYVLTSYAYLRLRQGQLGEVRQILDESLVLAREVASTTDITIVIIGYAGLATAQRDPQRAARLFGAADVLLEALHIRCGPTEHIMHKDYLAMTRAQLDEVTYATGYAEGRTMQLNEIIAFASSDEVTGRNKNAANSFEHQANGPASARSTDFELV